MIIFMNGMPFVCAMMHIQNNTVTKNKPSERYSRKYVLIFYETDHPMFQVDITRLYTPRNRIR